MDRMACFFLDTSELSYDHCLVLPSLCVILFTIVRYIASWHRSEREEVRNKLGYDKGVVRGVRS